MTRPDETVASQERQATEFATQDATQPTWARAPMSQREIRVVLGVLMCGVLLAAMVQTSLATALPTIAGELGGISELPWLVTAYLVTATAATPLFGKASDLYGRRRVLQVAVVVFTAGSLLAGIAGSMGTLVLARAIQGVGAAGLIVLPFAIVADLVSPRQRGRYQGYFGAAFGLANVVGPVLAGFLVDVATWRWIFYVNVPFGIVTFAVLTKALTLPHHRRPHRMDYLGATLLVAAVSTILLVLSLGGGTYPWTSPEVLALAIAGVVLTIGFVLREARADEPILPLRLLRNRVFTVANSTGFLLGTAMFGVVIYLPVYLQVVKGTTAAGSGLMLLPITVGFLLTSVATGRLVSRTGRYKPFAVVGTAAVAASTVMFATIGPGTSLVTVGAAMVVFGAGLGCVMQVLVLAVQNAVSHGDLGVATSSATFFRMMGGTFGTAVFGAVLAARLDSALPSLLPRGVTLDSSAVTGTPESIAVLPAPVRDAVVEAFTQALQVAFLLAVPVAVVAFLLACRLRELPLQDVHAVRADEAPVP